MEKDSIETKGTDRDGTKNIADHDDAPVTNPLPESNVSRIIRKKKRLT